MDDAPAHRFVEEWLAAWNAHDVEAVLAHFTDDVVFTSPVAARLVPESRGVLDGKAALRAYWTHALDLIPDLHFDLVDLYVGVGVIVINYRNQNGGLTNEVLVFDGDLVGRGYGTYVGGDWVAAGG